MCLGLCAWACVCVCVCVCGCVCVCVCVGFRGSMVSKEQEHPLKQVNEHCKMMMDSDSYRALRLPASGVGRELDR